MTRGPTMGACRRVPIALSSDLPEACLVVSIVLGSRSPAYSRPLPANRQSAQPRERDEGIQQAGHRSVETGHEPGTPLPNGMYLLALRRIEPGPALLLAVGLDVMESNRGDQCTNAPVLFSQAMVIDHEQSAAHGIGRLRHSIHATIAGPPSSANPLSAKSRPDKCCLAPTGYSGYLTATRAAIVELTATLCPADLARQNPLG